MVGKQDIVPDFGLRLRLARTQKKLMAKTVAERLGVTKATVSNWEKGNHMPNHAMIIRLADMYKVSIDYFYGIEYEDKYILDGLSIEQKEAIVHVVNQFKSDNKSKEDKQKNAAL